MKMVNRKKVGCRVTKTVLMIITLVHISKRKKYFVLSQIIQKFKRVQIILIQINQSIVYCPQGYDVQNTNILQPIFDGEKLLQVFKVCKSALLPAKECTANPSCKEFNYTLQNCLLEKHIKGTNRSALIICKKNKKGNMPLSRYTGSIFFFKRPNILIN